MIFFCAGFTKPGVTRGLLLGILGGGVPLSSPNPDPIPDQKTVIFHTLFRPRLFLLTLHALRLERQQKGFLKSISNSHITLSSLFIWN